MSNKLTYFPHDSDAHRDPFIQEAMRRFGHAGYSTYFILLELLHKDGHGDTLKIHASQLCLITRTKRKVIRNILGMFQESSKIVFKWNQDEIEIQIKKVRERWKKMKSKSISKVLEKCLEGALELEVEREQDPLPPKGEETEGREVGTIRRRKARATATAGEPGRGTSSMLDSGKTAQDAPGATEPHAAPPVSQRGLEDLTDETVEPGKAVSENGAKRKGTPLLEQKDPAAKLLGHHCKHFEAAMGTPHRPHSFSRDIKLSGELLQDYDFEKAVKLNALFFETLKNDEWVKSQGYSFFAFSCRINAMAVILRDRSPQASSSRSSLKVGMRRGEVTIGDETRWEEWSGTDWVEKSIKKVPAGGKA